MLLLAVMASTASARGITVVAELTMQIVCHAIKVYRWRSSARRTLPFRDVLTNSLQFVATPTMQSVSHASTVYRWRKSAEFTRKTWPWIPTFNHLRDALRSQSLAAELTLWSAKLVTPVSLRTNSAEGILTHMSALGSLPSHLILITATPRSGTPKSCMARWVPRSAAGTETGRRSSSARKTH